MKRKAKDITSVSHDQYMIRKLRERPKFAVKYLNAALEDTDDPAVFMVALRRVVEARGIAGVAKAGRNWARQTVPCFVCARKPLGIYDGCRD